MKKLETIKNVAGIIVGIGVSNIVSNAVKENTPEEVNALQKVTISLAAIVLGSMVADKTIDYFHKKIDAVVDGAKSEIEESKEPEMV